METPGGTPTHTLTTLALTLGDAVDAGWDLARLRTVTIARCPIESGARDVLTDVLIAAHAVLCGIDPDWAGLVQLWSEPALEIAVVLADALVRHVLTSS